MWKPFLRFKLLVFFTEILLSTAVVLLLFVLREGSDMNFQLD